MYIRECVATGAGTRRSSGHRHMHMQNFDRFHYYFSLLESLVKEVNDYWLQLMIEFERSKTSGATI